MNRLEEIQEIIKNFIYEKQQMKQEIAEIERKRTQLAEERNEKKLNRVKNNANAVEVEAEICELGKQIAELGNQSQEIQNKLDSKFFQIKNEVSIQIDNLISEGIRKIRKIEEVKEEMEQKVLNQKNKNSKYEIQKQDFFARFGRMPELSENAQKENQLQEKECNEIKVQILEIETQIQEIQEEISELAKNKKEFINGNWKFVIQENKITEQEENQELNENEKIENEIEVEEIKQITEEQKEESIILPCIEEFKEYENEIVEESIIEVNSVVGYTENQETEEINIEEIEPIEEIQISEIDSISEISIEEFIDTEEVNIEEFEPVEEIKVEEFEMSTEAVVIENLEIESFDEVQEIEIEEFKEEEEIDFVQKIEEMAKELEAENDKTVEINIEEEIQQINKIEEPIIEKIEENPVENVSEENAIIEEPQIIKETIENTPEENVIVAEEIEEVPKENFTFGEKVTILNIIAKFEEGEVLYKAQLSNGKTIKVYPTNSNTENLLLKDRENREELKEILINYAIAEYRILDKRVIKKIDPIVCEVLVKFAKEYNYDTQNLIYNYAMSFSRNEETELDAIPKIIYNFSFIEDTKLSKKEKEILAKICKNAKKNEKIEIIGYSTGFNKIKYIFKRTFSLNDANALPEGKY